MQVIVLTVRDSQGFRQKLKTKHARLGKARDIHLSVQNRVLGAIQRELKKLQERKGRPLEPFREGGR